jgi:hypothetical protein
VSSLPEAAAISPFELHWFVAVLVFESSLAEVWSDPRIDIQFRLIHAVDAEAAYQRAVALGKDEEHSYENPYGQTCTWSFKGLKDLQDVIDDQLVDGVEVYGFIQEGSADDHVTTKDCLTVFWTGSIDEDSSYLTDDP